MSSIKDFIKNKPNEQTNDNVQTLLKDNEEKVESLQENIKKYQNFSQSELMEELFKEAGKLKQIGKLNDNSLNALKSTLSPMLNDQQNAMLDNLLKQIK